MEEPEVSPWVRQWMRGKGFDMTLDEGIERTDRELTLLRCRHEQLVIGKCAIEHELEFLKLEIIEKDATLGVLKRAKEK